MLNKPRGVISTASDPEGRPNVVALVAPAVPQGDRVYPVGRLDADSTGLVLLTNDGELAHRLAHPRHGVAKEYRVTVQGRLSPEILARLSRGLYLADPDDPARRARRARPDRLRLLEQKKDRSRGDLSLVSIILREGQNREIRRLFARVGAKVRRLERVALGPLQLRGLASGQYRRLRTAEIEALKRDRSICTSRQRHPARPLNCNRGGSQHQNRGLAVCHHRFPDRIRLAVSVPFRGRGRSRSASSCCSACHLPRTTRSDLAANVLLYLPLGASLAFLLTPRLGGLAAVITATAIGALMSLAIELAQFYETRRVASLTDLSCNTIGRRSARSSRLRSHPPIADCSNRRYPACCGIRSQPRCSSPGSATASRHSRCFDPGRWVAAFAALAEGGWWSPAAIFQHALAWLVLIFAGERLAPGGRAVSPRLRCWWCWQAGSCSRACSSSPRKSRAWRWRWRSAASMLRLPVEHTAGLLAAALIVLIAIQGLAPFDFQLAQDRFALLPFGESLTHYRAANLPDMFLRCFSYGALVWLLAGSGTSILLATMLGAGVVFSVELLQTWLPGHTADVTDPLLAIAAGGLIALFERDGGRR